MQVPHIKITQAHLDKAYDYPEDAKSLLGLFNKAIEIALAEQRQEQLLISADEARKLGAGNAEWRWECGKWAVINRLFPYFTEAQYRAIKQPDQTCTRSHPHELMSEQCKELTKIAKANYEKAYPPEPVEPHAELKALYEQQVKDGTLKDFIWSFKNKPEDTETECITNPVFNPTTAYFCTPISEHFAYKHLYCQVLNENTGELKTMTREAAKLLQSELGDTVEWTNPNNGKTCCFFDAVGIYTYKPKAKPLKQVSWDSVPAGVMTNKGELLSVDNHRAWTLNELRNGMHNFGTLDLELAPSDQQPWIAVQDDDPQGFVKICFDLIAKGIQAKGEPGRFKVTGIAKGYELK